MNPITLLLISNDPVTRRTLSQSIPRNTIVITADTVSSGVRQLEQDVPTLVLCEALPQEVASLLQQARLPQRNVPVIVLGSQASVKDAVEVMRAGAADYLATPVTLKELEAAIRRVVTMPGQSCAAMNMPDRFDQIISVSPQLKLIKQLAREVALTDSTVLITGESGTGKELFTRAIHHASTRAHGPLIALNCAGIPESLLEAELFGYQQGAFTDAKHAKPGRFQLAEGGTLFLDEIGEMSAAAQAKLLRVLEDHTVDPLGGTQSHRVNIRVIAATNEDLLAQIKAGRFRLDLYYRLNVYQLRIPPLRERPEDIAPILQSFLDRARQERGCRIQTIAPEALTILQRHDWPGNVRELHNVVEWLTITCKEEVIQPIHLPATVRSSRTKDRSSSDPKLSLLAFGLSFQEMERKMLEEALGKASGNVSEASRLLKITRNTLRYRMAKYHLA